MFLVRRSPWTYKFSDLKFSFFIQRFFFHFRLSLFKHMCLRYSLWTYSLTVPWSASKKPETSLIPKVRNAVFASLFLLCKFKSHESFNKSKIRTAHQLGTFLVFWGIEGGKMKCATASRSQYDFPRAYQYAQALCNSQRTYKMLTGIEGASKGVKEWNSSHYNNSEMASPFSELKSEGGTLHDILHVAKKKR